MHCPGRLLQAVARAQAVSTGGPAVASSEAQGSATVDTVAASTDGTPSIAAQSASNGYASQVTINGDTQTDVTPGIQDTLAASTPESATTWDSAPTCTAAPDSTNSVLDQSGRLWGWENSKVSSVCVCFVSLCWNPSLTHLPTCAVLCIQGYLRLTV